MRKHLNLSGWLLALAATTLCGCGSSSKDAQVRILNVSTGYSSLDMYVNDGNSSSDTLELQSAASGAVSSYTSFKSGTYTVKFKVHGATDTLQSLSGQKLTDESHTTYIAYGSSGNFGALPLAEDQGQPDSGKSVVQVYNTAEAGSLDVYLTGSSTSLADASPTFSSIGSGSSGSITTDHGSYRLRVTGAGDKTDLRLDVASVTFDNQKIASLIFTSTQGGVLVNALLLPQQGSLTTYNNTTARIRGAVGISVGTQVTASIGSLSLLDKATVGIMGATYGVLDAGSVSVSLSVDGNSVSIPNLTLAAGADYTLLIWSNANGTQSTLISDDNHIPATSGDLKLRLLNGMSGLAAPITLNADFSPVAQDTAVGQASAPSQIAGGTNYELDVVDTTNGANQFSKTSVSLQAGNVYTLFMSGGGTAAVNGALKKDR
jgi:hypothetical protein